MPLEPLNLCQISPAPPRPGEKPAKHHGRQHPRPHPDRLPGVLHGVTPVPDLATRRVTTGQLTASAVITPRYSR